MTGDLLVVLPHGDPSVKNGIMGMSEQKILVLAVIKTSMLGMLYSGRYDESQQLIIRLDEERTRVEQGEYFETRQNRRWVTWKQICNPGRGPMEIWLCRQTAAGSGCLQYLVNGRGSAVMGGGVCASFLCWALARTVQGEGEETQGRFCRGMVPACAACAASPRPSLVPILSERFVFVDQRPS